MPKRRDLLERLSDDDPNYEVAKRFHLRAWADSHGLVADGLSRQVSLADFVGGCVRTFDQGAQAHVAFNDATWVPEKCRALDDLAKESIRLIKRNSHRNRSVSGKRRLGPPSMSSVIVWPKLPHVPNSEFLRKSWTE